MGKVYKSKIGEGLVITLVVILGFTFVSMVSGGATWVGIATLLPLVAFIVHMLFNTHYTIQGETVHIQCGFFRYPSVNIKTIRKISETNSLLAAPAVSMDRLEISYNRFDSIVISPKDKQGFIEELKRINPDIEVVYKERK